MNEHTNKIRVFAALLLAFAAGACDHGKSPTAVDASVQMAPLVVSDASSGGTYTLHPANSYPAESVVSAVIDRKGGEIWISDFAFLSVPNKAVTDPTTFTIRIVRNGYIEVDLTATRVINGQVVDVGAQGFAFPVNLKLNYGYAVGVLDPNRLRVLWEVDGTLTGRMREMPTTADAKLKWVTAKLDHFSGYVMASN